MHTLSGGSKRGDENLKKKNSIKEIELHLIDKIAGILIQNK